MHASIVNVGRYEVCDFSLVDKVFSFVVFF